MSVDRETLILSHDEVRHLLDVESAVNAVEAAFVAHARGEAQMPPKLYLPLEDKGGDFRAMPARMGESCGLKWVNAHPQNPARHGLPAVLGIYILSDPSTALPLAVMDATWLTAARTGAAAGVATRALARPGARSLGVIGAGAQCSTLVASVRHTCPGIDALLIADRDRTRAQQSARQLGGRVASVEEASACDVVCTATPTRTPIVDAGWVRPGAHINAMGADGPGKQELDADILSRARVYLDDRDQGLHSGEVNVPLAAGTFSAREVLGTLGEVLAGLAPGRASDDDITLFDSTGLAVQDVACARAVYEAALRESVGTRVGLVP